MPIDRRHAFAGGRVRQDSARRSNFLANKLGKSLEHLLVRYRINAAWQAFRQNARLGKDVSLGPNAWCVNYSDISHIDIGDNVVCRGLIRREAFGDARIKIHENVYIGDDCIISCANHVEIGSSAMIAHGVQVFDNDTHPLDANEREDHRRTIMQAGHKNLTNIPSAPIIIGPRTWLGFSSIILKGVTLGEGSIVAAGSVVTGDVAPYTVVAGNPARPVRSLGKQDGN